MDAKEAIAEMKDATTTSASADEVVDDRFRTCSACDEAYKCQKRVQCSQCDYWFCDNCEPYYTVLKRAKANPIHGGKNREEDCAFCMKQLIHDNYLLSWVVRKCGFRDRSEAASAMRDEWIDNSREKEETLKRMDIPYATYWRKAETLATVAAGPHTAFATAAAKRCKIDNGATTTVLLSRVDSASGGSTVAVQTTPTDSGHQH